LLRYFWPSDDEQLAGQSLNSFFSEDADWWVGVQKAGATLALAAGLVLSATNTLAAQQVFSQSQDDPVGSLFFQPTVQEEYTQPLVQPYNWPQPAQALSDTDQHPTFVSVFEADEDFWINPVQPIWGQNYLQLPLVVPEDFPAFPAANPVLDDGGLWAPQIPSADLDWNVLFFLDDGSWVPAFQPDEDFLPVQALPVPYNWPSPAQPFAIADEVVQEFVAAEDPIWLQLVQPVPGSLIWPQPWLFEQNENVANLVAFTDELYWQQLVQPTPASLAWPQQWAFEQTDATGALYLSLDEGLPGPLPAPVPSTYLLLQQWPFEQNEPAGSFSTLHDEIFWAPQIPAYNWPQPTAFTSVMGTDEVLAFPPNTGQDEDFWNYFVTPSVPPVPDAMFLRFPYLPDPEEIPAGSLQPFIPPPPQLCPLPPCGPDADTCISTFSNFNGGPILALLCRTCMSGLPLVVRGDYAIWCQTCCAFVSKDTTYMGTVRAPGQFRGRF
jgi:hypothetical protein